MTRGGGDGYAGTIFKIRPDATGYAIMHSFAPESDAPAGPAVGGRSDGRKPSGSLIALDGVHFGMTSNGGVRNLGTIFAIRPDGKGYSVLHSFSGGASDGANPRGSLSVLGGVLHGTTSRGGKSNLGTIFSIKPDGSGFAVLHSFSGPASDGSGPEGSLLAFDGVLFGLMPTGGGNKEGFIFRVNRDGSGFTVLHSFTGRPPEDGIPAGSLIVFRGVLYGMTSGGDVYLSKGAIFRINPDGTGFGVLHTFGAGGDDGDFPFGSLLAFGDSLYGATGRGGSSRTCRATWGTGTPIGCGTVFKIKPDGSDFALLHAFNLIDGVTPQSLVAWGGALYGTTRGGVRTAAGPSTR